MPARFVLDSFALMALFQDEPGAARVQELMDGAEKGDPELYLSVVNLGEVLYTVEARRGIEAAQEVLAFIDQSPIRIVDVDRALALMAARVKAASGIGYADCFVVACAQQLEAAVVTGDPDFHQVEGVVSVKWLPPVEP